MAAVGVAVVAAVVWFVRRPRAASPSAAQQQQQQRPIPVVTGPVQQKDLPIYLDGLGTGRVQQCRAVDDWALGEVVMAAKK